MKQLWVVGSPKAGDIGARKNCVKGVCTFMRILLYFLFLPVKMLAE